MIVEVLFSYLIELLDEILAGLLKFFIFFWIVISIIEALPLFKLINFWEPNLIILSEVEYVLV